MRVPRIVIGLACLLGIVHGAGAEPTLRIDQDDLRGQAHIPEPTLRIELIESADDIRVHTPAHAQAVFSDGTTVDLPANTKPRFVLQGATPPVRQYSVGIRTFLRPKMIEAHTVAAEWRAKGYTVRVLEAGRVYKTHAGAVLADTRLYWVAVGKKATEAEAKTLERKLQKDGAATWIIMEILQRATGQVEIRMPDGAVLGHGPTPVALTCAQPIQVNNVRFGLGFWGRGHSEHRRFPGDLEVDATADGMITLINTVGIEDYIAGVVPVEISVQAPLEAMKSQAVAARTETLAKLGIKHFGEPFDFCASQHCQEYGGITRANDKTDGAADGTRGIALMNGGGFVDAVYSANCGGHTEDNNNVWSAPANSALRGILDAPQHGVPFGSPLTARALQRWLTSHPQTYCGDPRVGEPQKFRWRVTMSPSKIKGLVNQHYRVGGIREIRTGERGVSGRLRSVRIIGETDSVTVRKELNIRRVFGGLKSAMFIVETARDKNGAPTSFTFIGGGWGHGVGMCQNGATGMALDGYKFPAILTHYFTGSYLQRVYD